jgi:hypothetical protein
MPLLGDENNRVKGKTLREIETLAESTALDEPFRFNDRRSLSPDGVLARRIGQGTRSSTGGVLSGLLSTCSNPRCTSGWLHLWRSRSGPIFESGWGCSSRCIAASIEMALRREAEGKRIDSTPHRHRVPLGLVMLEQGWITAEQLRQALNAQRSAGQGRLGKWLVRGQGVSEQLVTRALGLQWSCPVLPLEHHDPGTMAVILPRLFVEAFGALPLRVAAGQILYIGFEDRPDPVVTLAVERMLGLRVEAGLVRGSQFQSANQRMLNATYPKTELVEAASESPLVRVLTKAVERVRPAESRLVRMHDCLWLRMWKNPQSPAMPETSEVEDVICSLAAN